MSTTAAGRAASKTPRRAAPKPKWNNAVDSRDEQYQLKKKAVILEAARAFGRRGAANVSLDEIAAALNVTKPALYYYFKNKQDLIYECHELTMQVGDEALQKAIESERTGYARIAAFIRIYVPALTGELGAPALLRSDSALTPAQVKRTRERRRQFDLRLRGLVEDGIRDGTILPCDNGHYEKTSVMTSCGLS
jgi:TetR/AcrR family transcriptional regulator